MISREICQRVLRKAVSTGADYAEIFAENTVNHSINMIASKVDSIKDTDTFSGIIIKKGDELIDLTVDGMFIAIGLEPDNTPFKEVCDLNEWGYVIADEDCLTKTPGVFVAGDCRTKKLRQITTATSDGAYAAVNACRYIDQ